MTVRIIIGIVIGVGIGALMGHFGKCSPGTCPLTANPYRGAIYGGVMGAVLAFTLAGPVRPAADGSVAGSIQTGSSSDGSAHASAVVHVNSSTDFERHVANASIPCLADFYSDQCGPCRALAPSTETLAEKYRGRAVVCNLSLDAAPALAQPHGIRGIPAVLFFEGRMEVDRVVGLQPPFAYEHVLDAMISKRNEPAKEVSDANL